MVGSSNLGTADAIRRLTLDGRLQYIGVRHEGAASFAASGYAKLTGRPAACFAIAGPGATNLLTGLWDAKADRAPILALTGQVASQVVGPGAFQEIDLASAFAPVSRWSQTVQAGSNHVELANLAMRHAILDRDVAPSHSPRRSPDSSRRGGGVRRPSRWATPRTGNSTGRRVLLKRPGTTPQRKAPGDWLLDTVHGWKWHPSFGWPSR